MLRHPRTADSFARHALLVGLGVSATLALGCGTAPNPSGAGGDGGSGATVSTNPTTTYATVDCADACGHFIACGSQGITDPDDCPKAEEAFEWVVGAGASGGAVVKAVGFDAQEALVVAGTFYGTLDFGAHQLVSAGDQDVFVAKLGITGAIVWAQALGGAGTDELTGLAVAPDGTAFVARADPDLRLVSLGSDGALLWQQSYGVQAAFAAGTVVTPAGVSWLARDAGGDLFLAATYKGTASLGALTFASAGYTDVLVARLGPLGDPLWARSFGGATSDQVTGIAAASDGGVLFGGEFSKSADFGGMPVTSTGDYDGFIAKLSGDGALAFFTQVEGASGQEIGAVAATADGGAFVSGSFAFDAQFGAFALTTPPNYGPFVGRVDGSGSVLFARAYEGPQDPPIRYRVATRADDLVLAGHYSGSKNIAWPWKAVGMNDAFVLELGMLGEQDWTRTYGTAYEEEVWALATSPSGRIAVGGFYTGEPLTFGLLGTALPVGMAASLFVAVRSP